MADHFETETEEVVQSTFDGAKEYKPKRPSYYPSNTAGRAIINAITGVEYPWKVGSKDSERLFKVVDATGTHDSTGRKLKKNSKTYPNPNPNHCYYESPQQYMMHRKMTVNPNLIEQWEAKQQYFN